MCSLHLESEDLPFERDDKWLNMDQLEHDKLRWLTPLDKEDKKKKDQKNKVRNILSIIIKTMSILFLYTYSGFLCSVSQYKTLMEIKLKHGELTIRRKSHIPHNHRQMTS